MKNDTLIIISALILSPLLLSIVILFTDINQVGIMLMLFTVLVVVGLLLVFLKINRTILEHKKVSTDMDTEPANNFLNYQFKTFRIILSFLVIIVVAWIAVFWK